MIGKWEEAKELGRVATSDYTKVGAFELAVDWIFFQFRKRMFNNSASYSLVFTRFVSHILRTCAMLMVEKDLATPGREGGSFLSP